MSGRKFDSQRLAREAMQIAVQLPSDVEEAEEVLRLTRLLLRFPASTGRATDEHPLLVFSAKKPA